MAARPSTIETRKFASPAIKALMSQRSAEFGGLLLGLLGLAILVALATYDPRDPSLNTATTRHVSNLAGPAGAMLSDMLLQGFGVVGILPGIAMLTWSWRIASHRGLGSFVGRLAALLAAMPLLAATVSVVPLPHVRPWPVMAGPGGSIGQLISNTELGAGQGLFGIVGAASVWLLSGALAIMLGLLSLGLSRSEWRTAGRAAGSRRASRCQAAAARSVRYLAAPAGWAMRPAGWSIWLTASRPGARAGRTAAACPTSASVRWCWPRSPGESGQPVDLRPSGPARADDVRGVKPPRRRRASRSSKACRCRKRVGNFPPLDLLKEPPPRASTGPSEEALQANARLLETVLSDYGVQGEIVRDPPGAGGHAV